MQNEVELMLNNPDLSEKTLIEFIKDLDINLILVEKILSHPVSYLETLKTLAENPNSDENILMLIIKKLKTFNSEGYDYHTYKNYCDVLTAVYKHSNASLELMASISYYYPHETTADVDKIKSILRDPEVDLTLLKKILKHYANTQKADDGIFLMVRSHPNTNLELVNILLERINNRSLSSRDHFLNSDNFNKKEFNFNLRDNFALTMLNPSLKANNCYSKNHKDFFAMPVNDSPKHIICTFLFPKYMLFNHKNPPKPVKDPNIAEYSRYLEYMRNRNGDYRSEDQDGKLTIKSLDQYVKDLSAIKLSAKKQYYTIC